MNNSTIQEKFQMIINTIQSLDIKADYDTMNKLLGCLQLLSAMKAESKDWIVPKAKENSEEVKHEEVETAE